MPRRCRFLVVLFAAALAAGVGCGGKDKTVSVKGVVTLDGKPLSGATVTFVPVDQEGKMREDGRQASGVTDKDGSFQLTTLRSNDGALPGEYRVTVTLEPPVDLFAQENLGEGMVKNKKMGGSIMKSPQFQQKAASARKKLPPSPVPAKYKSFTSTPLKEVVPPPGEVKLELHSDARTESG